MTSPPFKIRRGNHNRDFNNERYKTVTDMSKYVWELKSNNKTASVNYEIMHMVLGKARQNFCRLCLTEKLEILKNMNDENLLNQRSVSK